MTHRPFPGAQHVRQIGPNTMRVLLHDAVRPVSNEEYHSISEANAEEGGSGDAGEEEGGGGERRSSRKTAISIGYDAVEVELDLSEMEPAEGRRSCFKIFGQVGRGLEARNTNFTAFITKKSCGH